LPWGPCNRDDARNPPRAAGDDSERSPSEADSEFEIKGEEVWRFA
jgi:hypothetical protein